MKIGSTEKVLGNIKNGRVTKTERSFSQEGKSQGKSTAYSTNASSKKIQDSEYGVNFFDNASYSNSHKRFSELSYIDPTEEMNKRWLK